jgi:ABC-2 type transport system permease protein
MSADAAIALRQVRYEHLAYWRNRRRVFFTFALPLMLVVILGALYGNGAVAEAGGRGYLTFFVPGMLAYGVIMTTLTGLSAGISQLKESGVLKRVRGTPVATWAYVSGHVGSALLAVAMLTAAVLAVAALAFGVDVPWHALPGIVSVVLVGAMAFSALGFGVVRFIKSADSGPPVVNFLILPLTFISGIWGPEPDSTLLRHIADVFPACSPTPSSTPTTRPSTARRSPAMTSCARARGGPT